SIVMLFFVKLPIWLAIITFMPFYCLIMALFIDLAGLHEFVKVHNRKWKWSEALTLLIAFIPYQLLLGIGAVRAVWRQMRWASNRKGCVGPGRKNNACSRRRRAFYHESILLVSRCGVRFLFLAGWRGWWSR